MSEQAVPTEESPDRLPADTQHTEAVVVSDLLVEEVSIDGMCGVY